MDWSKMLDAARAENSHGIEVRRGKKYTTAAIRVEIMRRHAGDSLGVETEIIHWATDKGAPVVVKATIRDATGRIVATGHAEEIRGQGQVNSTSALENAETSAIGRALAALGLSGGEFASANEMDGVERKAEAMRDEPPFMPEAAAERIRKALDRTRTLPELEATWKAEAEARARIKAVSPELAQTLLSKAAERKAALVGNDPAMQAPT